MVEIEDDPKKGIAYYLIHTVLLSVNLYTNKDLFARNPTASLVQFTFIRGLFCFLFSLMMGVGSLKRDLYSNVDSRCLPSLVFRCVQGALSVFISFMCIKYFEVSTVGITCALQPVIVCLLAYFVLGERMRRFDQLSLVLLVVCVSLVILGAESTESTDEKAEIGLIPLVALLSQPVLLAMGTVAMRQMRRLPETCCSTYQNATLFVLSGCYLVYSGTSFSFVLEFSLVSWALIMLSSLTTVATQLMKFKAFKYQQASKL